MPRKTRLGYIAQEAPSGSATPFETVLAADAERADLLERSEIESDPDRLADIHERLIAIDAYTAPARAARILIGLGFDEDMQGRPLDSFSGGWKMRVALAALLFSNPDLLLLDEHKLPRIGAQEAFEPHRRFEVEVVRRFVEQQQVGVRKEQRGKRES